MRLLLYVYSVFLSGAGNSTARHRNARFLFDFFGRLNPEHNIIPNPSQQDSSARQICRTRCQKGWISYKDHCYMLIQERMTWLEAEVLGCSKQQCLSFLLCFPQLSFLCLIIFSSISAASVMYQC